MYFNSSKFMEFVLKSILFDLSTILFEKSTSSFPEYVRPLKKEVTSPNFLYSHPCFIVPPYRYCYSSAPRRGNFSTGQHPGYDVIMSYSPCKGSFNISSFFIVALTGRNHLNTFYPGRCPGLWRPLGFQPVDTNKYPNHSAECSLLDVQTIIPSHSAFSPCKRCWFPIFASSFLLIPIVLALRPGGATSPQPRATPWV